MPSILLLLLPLLCCPCWYGESQRHTRKRGRTFPTKSCARREEDGSTRIKGGSVEKYRHQPDSSSNTNSKHSRHRQHCSRHFPVQHVIGIEQFVGTLRGHRHTNEETEKGETGSINRKKGVIGRLSDCTVRKKLLATRLLASLYFLNIRCRHRIIVWVSYSKLEEGFLLGVYRHRRDRSRQNFHRRLMRNNDGNLKTK